MRPVNIYYVVGFVVFVYIPQTCAINCFQCSSREHPDCADVEVNDTSSPYLHKCEPRDNRQMFCRKIVQRIMDTPNFTRITRTCGWLVYKGNTSGCLVTDSDFKKELTCQCFTDACNVGKAVATPVGVTLLGVVLGLLFGAL